MGKKERLLKTIEDNCGVITTKEVLELGFHKDTIKALVLDNTLEKVATGLYAFPHENIDEYFKREVLPFSPDAWIDTKKSKVGYEIPFTRYFYKYEAPQSSTEIMSEIMGLETELSGSLKEVFDL